MFVGQFKVSCENCRVKSILSQITTFRVVTACVVAKTTFLIQFEVSSENRHLRWLEIVFIFPRLVLQTLFQIQFVHDISVKFTTETNEMS